MVVGGRGRACGGTFTRTYVGLSTVRPRGDEGHGMSWLFSSPRIPAHGAASEEGVAVAAVLWPAAAHRKRSAKTGARARISSSTSSGSLTSENAARACMQVPLRVCACRRWYAQERNRQT